MRKENHNRIQVQGHPRLRRRTPQERLADMDEVFHTLGVTFWQTDMSLRLVDSQGMVIAESFHGRPVAEFYRDAYGLDNGDSQPIQAHRDARIGMSVTLHYQHASEQFVILVEPWRNDQGEIIGTMGMSLRLGSVG